MQIELAAINIVSYTIQLGVYISSSAFIDPNFH